MASALAAANAFVGATAPNPPVGCALLDVEGRLLACAAHERAGGPHAETAALSRCREAGWIERLHTVVVTLEPCNHVGRTGPCTEALLQTPARAVWIGASDPNPTVAGGGAAMLRAAGVSVRPIAALDHPHADDLSRQAQRLIAPFALARTLGRPWLTLKQAITADGAMSAPGGRGVFTSPASLSLAHRLRRRADAIVTGSGCILADDPAFTVRRVADHPGRRRKLVILDRRGRTPAAYVQAAQRRGFDVRVRAELGDALAELAADGVNEALVEAGPTLLQTFLSEGLWDEHVVIRQGDHPGAPDTVTWFSNPARSCEAA